MSRCTERRIALALCASIALLATRCEKRRLQERADRLEQQRTSLTERLDRHREALRASEARIDSLNRDLAGHNTEVQAFIQQHRAAAACIRATNITFSNDSQQSQTLASAAGLGTVLCTVAMINPAFTQEMDQVVEHLAEADRRAREIKRQIADTEQLAATDRDHLRRDETELDRLTAEIDDLRGQIGAQ